jgi:hypothetical protein
MGRFCAAYGIGGLLNAALLRRGRDAVKQHFVASDALAAAEPSPLPSPGAKGGVPAHGHVIVAAVQNRQVKPN